MDQYHIGNLTDTKLNTNSTAGGSHPSMARIRILQQAYFISGISVAVLSLVAAIANGFLLLALWKDPHKKFRIPSTVFVVGLTIADFLTGILVGPLVSYIRISFSVSPELASHPSFPLIAKLGETLSLVTMNSSYLILLFMTWNQFIATRYPHNYRNRVTTRRVTLCVCCAWTYAIMFALLPLLGVPKETIHKIDYYAHNCTFIALLVIAYMCLFVAFKRQASRIRAATNQNLRLSLPRSTGHRGRRSEKQFTVVTMGLVFFIIICTLPSTILYSINIYTDPGIVTMIAAEVSGVILFLKFSLDPFLYCWRLRSYRRALKTTITCGRIRYDIDDLSGSIGSTTRRAPYSCKDGTSEWRNANLLTGEVKSAAVITTNRLTMNAI